MITVMIKIDFSFNLIFFKPKPFNLKFKGNVDNYGIIINCSFLRISKHLNFIRVFLHLTKKIIFVNILVITKKHLKVNIMIQLFDKLCLLRIGVH